MHCKKTRLARREVIWRRKYTGTASKCLCVCVCERERERERERESTAHLDTNASVKIVPDSSISPLMALPSRFRTTYQMVRAMQRKNNKGKESIAGVNTEHK